MKLSYCEICSLYKKISFKSTDEKVAYIHHTNQQSYTTTISKDNKETLRLSLKFNDDGYIFMEKANAETNKVEQCYPYSSIKNNYNLYPEFGKYNSIFRVGG